MYRNVTVGDITFTTNGTFVLNSIDIGSPEVDITSVPMNVGDFVIGNRMGGRDITLTGYVCTRDTQDSSTLSIVYLKQQLQKELLPLKEVTLIVDGCSIKCYAKSSIEWSVPFEENNKELCKFSVELFASNPFFHAPLKKVLAGDTFNMVNKRQSTSFFQIKYSVSNAQKADFRAELVNHLSKSFTDIDVNINGNIYAKIHANTAVDSFVFDTNTGKFFINGNEVTPYYNGTITWKKDNVVDIYTDVPSGDPKTFDECIGFSYSGTKPLVDTVSKTNSSKSGNVYTINYNATNKDKAAVKFSLQYKNVPVSTELTLSVNGASVAVLDVSGATTKIMMVNLQTGSFGSAAFVKGIKSYTDPVFVEGNNVITVEGNSDTFYRDMTFAYAGTLPLEDTFQITSAGPKVGLTYTVVYNASNGDKADFRGTFEASGSVTNTSIIVNVNGTLFNKYSVANAGRVLVIDSHTGVATLDGTTLSVSQSGTLNLKKGENKVEVVADNEGFVDCTSFVYSGTIPLERYNWYCEGKYFGVNEDVRIVTQTYVSNKEIKILVSNKGHNSRDFMTFSFYVSSSSTLSTPILIRLKMNSKPWVTLNISGVGSDWELVRVNMYTGELLTPINTEYDIIEWNSEYLHLGSNVIDISVDEGDIYSPMSYLDYSVSLLEV